MVQLCEPKVGEVGMLSEREQEILVGLAQGAAKMGDSPPLSYLRAHRQGTRHRYFELAGRELARQSSSRGDTHRFPGARIVSTFHFGICD